MTKTLSQLALEFYNIAKDVFERQSTAQPCIYFYNDKFDFSRGDTLGGTAEPVYNNKAVIVIDTEDLREYVDPYQYDEETAVMLITEKLEFFLSEIED